jgi:hypothetical protein
MKRSTVDAVKVKSEYPTEGPKKISSATTAVRARRAALGELQSNKENSRSAGTDSKLDVKRAIEKANAPSRSKPIQRRSTRQSTYDDAPVEEVKRPVVQRRVTTTTQESKPAARPKPRTITAEKIATTSDANIPKRAGLKRTHTATSVTEARVAKPAASSKLRVKHEEEDEEDREPSSKRQRTTSPVEQEDTDVEGYVAPKKLFSKRLPATKEFDDVQDEEPMLSPASDVSETNGRDPRVVVDMDIDDADDPTMVLEYQEDIFEYMRDLEVSLIYISKIIG